MATSIDYSDRLSSDVAKKAKLLSQVTCPHCWERFQPEQVLWISEHVDLLGDPLLGPEQEQRFLPSRFTLDGDAIDARGMTCRALACPRCHLPVPRAMLEMEPLPFDPTQDLRFRAVCLGSEPRQAAQRASRLTRQETILTEIRPRDIEPLGHGSIDLRDFAGPSGLGPASDQAGSRRSKPVRP